ncbi:MULTISPECIES: M55 family metallopeptidase [Desulfosediminicola]|uniref:M55 family metallopeptidase n=1 Tax=Desulfosediminicola TaxID=2886823 RepID=UPI0010ABD6DD|nr:M55 family metallopeptidase [Desulfosediminicola ganghwensis]
MKIFISADIEGVCGVTAWDETESDKANYAQFQKQMTREVCAACEGAIAGGATEIYVRDAHNSARNLIAEELPKQVRLVRGWSRHPYMMMQELDSSFDGVMMIGYHSQAGGDGNPLAHTMTSRVSEITINGMLVSEFLMNTHTAWLEDVPVIFLSGDKQICTLAQELIPELETVAVKSGSGGSTVNLHPLVVLDKIEEGARKAMQADSAACRKQMPEKFETSITYVNHQDAYKASFFPGARRISSHAIAYEADNYFDVLRLFLFNL